MRAEECPPESDLLTLTPNPNPNPNTNYPEPEPEPEPEPISRLHLACISPEQVRVMRAGVADCICLAAGGRLPKQRARQITQLCIPAP